MVNNNSSDVSPAKTLNNYFKKHYVQQQFEVDNLKLNSNCNTFDNNATHHFSWVVFDKLKFQGVCGNNKNEAESNLFIHPYGLTSHNKDIHLDVDADLFDYNSNPNFTPQYHNDYGVVLGCPGSGYSSNLPDACPKTTFFDKVAEGIDTHHGIYISHLTIYKDLRGLMDGGDTKRMLEYIEEHQLQYIDNLPADKKELLSDEVLWRLFDRLIKDMDWQRFDAIFTENSPLNPKILDRIVNSNIVPNPIKQHIQSVQVGISPRSFIDEQLKVIENELGLALNDLLTDFIEINEPKKAMELLANDPTNASKIIGFIFDPYNHYGYDFGNEVNKIVEKNARLDLDTTPLIELRQIQNYFQEKVKVASNLNASNSIDFKSFANTNSITGIYASVALAANGKAKYGYNPRKPRFVNGYRKATYNDDKVIEPSIDMNISENPTIYPNPAHDKLCINFPTSLAQVKLTDIFGKLVIEKLLTTNEGIDVSSLSNGCYFLKVNNLPKPFKVIIQH